MAGVKRNKCDREELRKRVIEEASRAFGKYGIRNVHMDNLACALSISKRTLYELFCDKEQLLLEVLIMHQQKMGTYISEVASRAQNALEVIFAFYKRADRAESAFPARPAQIPQRVVLHTRTSETE